MEGHSRKRLRLTSSAALGILVALGAIVVPAIGPTISATISPTMAEPRECSRSGGFGLCDRRDARPVKPCKQKCKPCRTVACRRSLGKSAAGSPGSEFEDHIKLPAPQVNVMRPANRGVAGADTTVTLTIPAVADPFLSVDGRAGIIHIYVDNVALNVRSRPGEGSFYSDFVNIPSSTFPNAAPPLRVANGDVELEAHTRFSQSGTRPTTVRITWRGVFSANDGRPDVTLPLQYTESTTLEYPVVAVRAVLTTD